MAPGWFTFLESFGKITLTFLGEASPLLIPYDTHAFWRITSTIQASGDHHHFLIWTPSLTLQWSGPFCRENLCSGYNSGISLVVALKYNFFVFTQVLNKYLRSRIFRKSYVHYPVVVPTNHCQICAVFFTWCEIFKVVTFRFFTAVCPQW